MSSGVCSRVGSSLLPIPWEQIIILINIKEIFELILRLRLRSVPRVWHGDPSQLGSVNVRGLFSALEHQINVGSTKYSTPALHLCNEWCLKIVGDHE